jgi:hypothetical protein
MLYNRGRFQYGCCIVDRGSFPEIAVSVSGHPTVLEAHPLASPGDPWCARWPFAAVACAVVHRAASPARRLAWVATTWHRGETMKSIRFAVPLAVLTGLALFAAPAAALDVPQVEAIQSKPGSVRLMIHAGASGAPRGFYVERMEKSEFDALGGWPEDTSSSWSWMRGTFTGTPSFNVEGTADAYALAAGEAIEVELGQLFEETGLMATDLEELDPNTQYVIRLRANGSGLMTPSDFTPTMVVQSAPLAQNCTFTLGYWKNHFESWPVAGLTLGTVNYTNNELLAILWHQPQGNKLVILTHQLIAAKLNLANGADPGAIAATIASADALIGGLVSPPIGAGTLPSSPAVGYANTLDDFNNGLIGPGHCGSVPASTRTWGSVKALYRN